MSATSLRFTFNAKTGEAEFSSSDGETLFVMGELSFAEANSIHEAIQDMERRAYDRGAAEAISRIRKTLHGMEEKISLDADEDDEAPVPHVRRAEKRRRIGD